MIRMPHHAVVFVLDGRKKCWIVGELCKHLTWHPVGEICATGIINFQLSEHGHVYRERHGLRRFWAAGVRSSRHCDPAGAMLHMGRPTLSVPERMAEFSGERIVIGWKDTREARLAVRDAMPFLTRASLVTIAEICTSGEQDAARKRVRDVAGYLQRHGVQCQHEVRVHTAEPDGAYLGRLASEVRAELIVAGGYGHSRLGEWIFGGMTQTLLQQAKVCLLMSH